MKVKFKVQAHTESCTRSRMCEFIRHTKKRLNERKPSCDKEHLKNRIFPGKADNRTKRRDNYGCFCKRLL